MFADDGIIFPHGEFFGEIAWIFLGYIIKASICGADQFNFQGIFFCHFQKYPNIFAIPKSTKIASFFKINEYCSTFPSSPFPFN